VGLPAQDGVLLTGVHDNSVAAHAGLKQGDLIVAVGDTAVSTPAELALALDQVASDTVTLQIVRGVETMTVEVTFGPTQPDDTQS
jgi:serine protease Do